TYQSDNEVVHCDPEASNNIDILVDKIAQAATGDMEDREHTILSEMAADVAKQTLSPASQDPVSQVNPATQCDVPSRE
ncbi:hypothetical protein A2U01_0093511, partial [Trifolium medium]|nr:hypothetical protein [Trifolium medium]